MRKFIMSDIHGYGNAYYSMMGYLDNISREEDIELYINGDLFDRGYESAEILLDVKRRIEENKFKIVYLGGNHELLMYDFFRKREEDNQSSIYNDWYQNGGLITDEGLYDILKDEDEIKKVVNFVSNLKIYHKFAEKINGKKIVLVHAACPSKILNKCNIKIKDNNKNVHYAVWTREHGVSYFLDQEIIDPHEQRVGHKKYFTIIGHTPVDNEYGYEYHKKQNYLNIDGGCAFYAEGLFQYDHFPLVEVRDSGLNILTFNSNNEIVYGNFFDGVKSYAFPLSRLEYENSYLNKDVKIKKLSLNSDGIVIYEK